MKKSILVSDLTGAEINDAEYVQVELKYGNTRETLDANKSELSELIGKGVIKKRAGRPPKNLAAVA